MSALKINNAEAPHPERNPVLGKYGHTAVVRAAVDKSRRHPHDIAAKVGTRGPGNAGNPAHYDDAPCSPRTVNTPRKSQM